MLAVHREIAGVSVTGESEPGRGRERGDREEARGQTEGLTVSEMMRGRWRMSSRFSGCCTEEQVGEWSISLRAS